MKILRAIGAFFARIGRWIRDTAWVQPLLIVGGIFLIIFSIPYLSKWVGSWFSSGDAATKYYKSHALKLDDKDNNEATRILAYLEAYGNNDAEGIAKGKKEFGDRFFLSFVKEDCADCKSGYAGFQTLEKNWNKNSYQDMGGSFKYYTIFADKKDSDGEYIFSKANGLYEKYQKIFENIAAYYDEESGNNYYYVINNSSIKSSFYDNLKTLSEPDTSGFTTPTTFYIDMRNGDYSSSSGVASVLFNYTLTTENSRTDAYAKANVLRDCWKQQGDFAYQAN